MRLSENLLDTVIKLAVLGNVWQKFMKRQCCVAAKWTNECLFRKMYSQCSMLQMTVRLLYLVLFGLRYRILYNSGKFWFYFSQSIATVEIQSEQNGQTARHRSVVAYEHANVSRTTQPSEIATNTAYRQIVCY